MITTVLTQTHLRQWGKEFEFNLLPMVEGIHHKIIVDPDRDRWVGYSTYDPTSKVVTTLEVNEKYRGQGFGRTLLGLWPSAECVYVEARNPAISFYKKEGWRDIGDHPLVDLNGIKPARGGHWIHMVK
tara:strand:+ start:403 stop:786 length:384 start_codon:yes stop_codon:yes gene_type:complete